MNIAIRSGFAAGLACWIVAGGAFAAADPLAGPSAEASAMVAAQKSQREANKALCDAAKKSGSVTDAIKALKAGAKTKSVCSNGMTAKENAVYYEHDDVTYLLMSIEMSKDPCDLDKAFSKGTKDFCKKL